MLGCIEVKVYELFFGKYIRYKKLFHFPIKYLQNYPIYVIRLNDGIMWKECEHKIEE